jgi:hypothetical protein
MPRFCWIDLNEAAVRLASTREDVSTLIDDGSLRARTFDGAELVVRSDEVDQLAEIFTANKQALRGPHVGRTRRSDLRS